MPASSTPKNILFIMYDQLRWDYLSCAGHPHLHTPNFDWVASQGVRFTQAFVQSAVCGASRMSTYTGRYVSSHGAAWNGFPLKVGELTLGDHLRRVGMDAILIGKTHMRADIEGMERLGVDPDSIIGARVGECGFDVYVRDDGMDTQGPDGKYFDREAAYSAYLRDQGYASVNPWHDHANSSVDQDLKVLSGFAMEHARLPANVREQDSETPWLTRQMIDWLAARDPAAAPWCVHLSYIKPHWPFIAPAPYNALYGPDQVLPRVASNEERQTDHRVYRQYQDSPIGQGWARNEVRDTTIPAYMGLIKQCDDQLGHLLKTLRRTGRLNDTLIVLTSDHGDNLGDHWLGEKDMMHDSSLRVPLIIYDPSGAADSTRGGTCDALVESIDLVPTFLDFHAGPEAVEAVDHILEGRSLLPLLHGAPGTLPPDWRAVAVSEYDYSMTPHRVKLGVGVEDARWTVLTDARWKFTHFEGGFRPMLFDRQTNPQETIDRAQAPDAEAKAALDRMYAHLATFRARVNQRTTLSKATIKAKTGASRRKGIVLGLYEQSAAEDLLSAYGQTVERDYRGDGEVEKPRSG